MFTGSRALKIFFFLKGDVQSTLSCFLDLPVTALEFQEPGKIVYSHSYISRSLLDNFPGHEDFMRGQRFLTRVWWQVTGVSPGGGVRAESFIWVTYLSVVERRTTGRWWWLLAAEGEDGT